MVSKKIHNITKQIQIQINIQIHHKQSQFKIQRSKTRKEKNYGKRLVAGRKDKTKDINKTRSNLYHYYCI